MKDKNKVFYKRTTVDFHSFVDLISIFKPEHLTDNYYVYRKMLVEEYQTDEDILNIVELVRNIEVDDETRASITKKVTAQQELELAKIQEQTAKVQAQKDKEVAIIAAEQERETAQINAEKAKIAAEGDANALKVKAQAEADALKIQAQAEAEANQRIAQSLTPELIEKQKIDKWKGEVPEVTGNATPIVKMD